jgi:hypothetical protein
MTYPTNAQVIAFCFFEGSTLSVPVGALIKRIWDFTPPAWTAPFYLSVVAFSVLSLFVWSFMSFHDQPFLASIGLITFLCVAGGLLLPTL